MNILLDGLPNTVKIDDEVYPIRTDFRVGIRFEKAMLSPNLSDMEKLIRGIELFYLRPPANLAKAVEKLLWFYRAGREKGIEAKGGRQMRRIYDFSFDAEYIYSAYLSQYRIDLTCGRLHWWKFLALFKGLNEDNEIVKIMGYRSMVIDGSMSKEKKEFYGQMKKKYALPGAVSRDERQKMDAIEAALLGDGNVSKVL